MTTLRAASAALLVGVVLAGCAPVIIDVAPEDHGGDGGASSASSGASAQGSGGAAGGGSAGGGGSTSASTGGGPGGGPLGPTEASCAAADQSGSQFGAACAFADCGATLAPPAMVGVPVDDSGEGGHFCIDATSVTQGQYAAFLAAHVAPEDQPARCQWNETFVPGAGATDPVGGECPAGSFDPAAHADDPATCVDLCDAEAYCLWAGKRLCGKIGGGDVSWEDDGKPSIDQYVHACAWGGVTPEPLASKVYEWEPVCNAALAPGALCNVRDEQCYIFQNWAAGRQSTRVGFRCCAD